MKIYDESLYCQECDCEITVAQSKFCNNYCDECNYCDDCYRQEQDMQSLDQSADLDQRLESSTQRWQESQADQDYWQQHQAPWQDHSPTCNCPSCCGEEPY